METGGSRLPGGRKGNTGARKGGKKERCEKDGKTGQMKNMHREACREDFTIVNAAAEVFHGW